MSKLKLTLACWDYDRTRPLIDSRVQAEGIDLNIKILRPRELRGLHPFFPNGHTFLRNVKEIVAALLD